MKVTKRFKWIMGHRLTFHKGGCYNPHGHNYECKITIEGEVDRNGILMDFSELKEVFNKVVYEPLDHSFMVYEKDNFSYLLKKWDEDENRPFKWIEVSFETTAENIAIYLFELFKNHIDTGGRKVTRVKIYETPASEAVYYGK